MKSITIIILAICWCASPVFSVPVQPQPWPFHFNFIESADAANAQIRFVAHRQRSAVAMMWHVDVPSLVEAFDIERSYDGEYFEAIGSKACNNSSMFRHEDKGAFPGLIHYRIKGYLYNGDVIYSDVSLVRIIQKG